MLGKRTRGIIVLLILLSICIYGVQLWVFKDPNTTAFYILQDMAFMPFTIAIATIVVGEVMNERDKRERLHKTRMLTSTFFTELGSSLLLAFYQSSECGKEIQPIVQGQNSGLELKQLQNQIKNANIQVTVTKELYSSVKQLVLENQTKLLVISSNPLLLEHEDFTDMLWGVFHLVDEFRLRGDFDKLKDSDIEHFESDFSSLFELILLNWVVNVQYMKENYPHFFGRAKNKLEMMRLNK
ncbi:hypothetical protein P261_00039 [Lachnospiraceae bacterium TWA4]|nr:hypothetical protein P261_00039 [Lachnospiraceae bacterium TWA4]